MASTMMKLLVCMSLALTCVAAKYECTPGTLFKNDCNTCSCSDEGKILACTRMTCPPKENSNIIRIDSIQDHKKQECTPGTTYNDYCNVCTCLTDGSGFACTLMYCDKNVWNKDGTLKETTLTHKSENENKEVCKAGTTFNDYCNVCLCSNDGTFYFCTMMFCDKNVWNKDGSIKDTAVTQTNGNEITTKQVCNAGATFNDYCNVCLCSNDGTFYACSMMYCDKNVWNQDGSIKDTASSQRSLIGNKQVCTPGAKFNDYCNTCICSDDGVTAICTAIYCDKNVWNQDGSRKDLALITKYHNENKQICTPGTTFNDYCNVCSCLADGSNYYCTLMFCDENVWNKDGTLKESSALTRNLKTENKQVCTPGTTYNDYCNMCTCLSDGSNYFCTLMFCDKNVWNKDGTLKESSGLTQNLKTENKQVCTPGTTYNDYCNLCTCLADGSNFYCTLMFCDKNVWNKDGTLKESSGLTQNLKTENKQVCTPGTTFNDYCNVCQCLADGSNYFCTIMACDENIWNKDGSRKDSTINHLIPKDNFCEPGKKFRPDNCNFCICNKDGTDAACTSRLCLGNFKAMHEISSEEKWGPLYKEGDACMPGKSFYSECNQCVCTESGRSAFCTLMSCQRSP